MMKHILRYLGQAVFYGLFVAVIGYFSTAPAYVHFPPDMALIKASFSHAGQPKAECHVRTAEELASLPPNMRNPVQCGRERSPVVFELDLDGQRIFQAELAPAGLSRDGASTVYRRFPVRAGRHRLHARLQDSVRVPDFNYTKEADVTLVAAQVFVVEFDARAGGFVFK
ncbi:MAG: hypothetical protein Q7J84_13465 [Sulfuricaulis sp.]|nr:hypothetical protein [Sulfuricaulis sp.]